MRSLKCWIACAVVTLFGCGGEHRIANAGKDAPVILISIDTLRADHLPMYGYDAVKTPHLDALRADSILYTSAWAHVPLTLPSHATVFTGLLPANNGVRSNIGYRLGESVPTLSSMLRDDGYDTGAVVSSYVLRASTGLNRAFNFYDDAISNRQGVPTGMLQRPGKQSTDIAKQWLSQHGNDKPFLLFLHLFEPHAPYTPPEPYRTTYASSPYDGEIATVDEIVGEFIDDLKQRGIYDRALIIVFGDHGEGLSEHGEPEHGIFLYREATHVPLLVKLPNAQKAGETRTEPVGLVDILPTIAEVTGAKLPAKLDGQSLLGNANASRQIYSETMYPRIHLGWSELRSLQDNQYQFIQAPRPELYDHANDPREKTNIINDQRRVYHAMKSALDQHAGELQMPSRIDPEEAKKLAALGYLSSSQTTNSNEPLPDPKDRIGEIAAMSEAAELERQGELDRATAAYRAIVAKNPRFTDAWNQLALLLEHRGMYEEASEAYRQAIVHAVELAGEFALSRGGILLRLGNLDEAAKQAEVGAKVNPGGAHLLLARVALARKDYATARNEALAAQKESGTHLAASVVLAQTMVETGQIDAALQELDRTQQRAHAEAAEPVEALDSTRGDALARTQRYAEAEAALRRAITAFPSDSTAYARLAIVYVVMNRRDDARATIAAMTHNNASGVTRQLADKTRRELGL